MQDKQGFILAGTEGDGVFASFDDGAMWHAANEGLTINRVYSLGVDGQGRPMAGTSAGVFQSVEPAGAKVGAIAQRGRTTEEGRPNLLDARKRRHSTKPPQASPLQPILLER